MAVLEEESIGSGDHDRPVEVDVVVVGVGFGFAGEIAAEGYSGFTRG